MILENNAQLGIFGLAKFEDLWRNMSVGKDSNDKVVVLSGEFEKISTIYAYNFKGGFAFLYSIISMFRKLVAVLMWAGIFLIFSADLYTLLETQPYMLLCQ